MPPGVGYSGQGGNTPSPQGQGQGGAAARAANGASALPTAPPQAGPLPGQMLQPAGAAAADQLFRLMGQAMLQMGQEMAAKGTQSDPTVLAQGKSMMTQVQQQLQGFQASSGRPQAARFSPVSRLGGQPAQTTANVPGQAQFAGEGDRASVPNNQRLAA